MFRRFLVVALIAATSGIIVAPAAPVGPVVNGGFELYVPGKATACEVFGTGAINVLPPDQDPEIPDPTDPDQNLPWLWLVSVSACESGALKAAQWSSSWVSQFDDYDGDGDREVRIDGSVDLPPGDSIGKNHNFWQAYPNPQQAYSANFGALTYRVEDGVIPSNASVILSLSTTPSEVLSPYVGVFLNCQLAFRGMSPDADGLVTLDPTTGTFTSRDPDCDVLAAAWASSDAAHRRTILGRTRIVQLSFWNFNRTDATITLDDVSIDDARLFVEDLVDEGL